MPSTFTQNLGVEKPGAGEQTGLWGTTANSNFDIFDRAINGVRLITLLTTTYTLTTTNGVLSEGQFAMLRFVGTPGGATTVTVAPNTAQKVYLVRNDSNQALIFTQGSGGNVAIPAGRSGVLACTGGGATSAVYDITFLMNSANPANLANSIVQRDTSGNFAAGTITASLAGNASTATALQTARTIGGVSFNGTANINLPGVNAPGNQNTTGSAGSAASLTTGRNLTIGAAARLFNGTADLSWTLADIGAQPLNARLTGFAAAPDTNGFVVKTGSNTFLTRVISGDGTSVTVTNTDGAAGFPIVSSVKASQAEAIAGTDANKSMTALTVKQALNAGGAAPTYADRAWVNFNGTGSIAIRASGNVSSVTDLGTGVYRINFVTAMPDTNYGVAISVGGDSSTQSAYIVEQLTTSVTIGTTRSGVGPIDQSVICVSVIR